MDDRDPDREDIGKDTSKGTYEAAPLEDEADLVQNEADIPLYSTREMQSQGNYILEQLLEAEYRPGWRFLRQWAGYPVSDANWEPVKAFVHGHGKLNEIFVEFCLAGAPQYDIAMRAARRLSQTCKKGGRRRKHLCKATGGKSFFRDSFFITWNAGP